MIDYSKREIKDKHYEKLQKLLDQYKSGLMMPYEYATHVLLITEELPAELR